MIDLVVFDEAHYMRNRETAAWKLGDLLRGVADYQLMLSATPINLKNLDLFNLLRLLDPDHFSSEYDFAALISANKPLVAARDAVLNRKSTAGEVLEQLEAARVEPLLSQSRQLQALMQDPPTDKHLAAKEYRAEIADSLERMNLLSHVITRTRKRDVQEHRIKRDVSREAVVMSPAERELYDTVTEATRQYAWEHGINDGFLLATPQRQVTSCPAAIAESWSRGGDALEELFDDLEGEYEDRFEFNEADTYTAPLKATLMAIVPRVLDVAALREHDTKFERLMAVAGRFLQEHPRDKIIIFTSFRPTARYLTERLQDEGLPARLLLGGMQQSKQEVIDEFRTSKTLRVLVSTEVASEGVDLQFSRVVVNYDLPWNPTRIEQRIGRIDRLGQKADIVHVWNLFFADTIDDRVVVRLLERLRIFEEALGEAEAVVGEQIRKLESELLSRPLTAEEEDARIDAAAQALEILRIHREELERNAAHMMAHGQRVIEKIDAARELARRVTEKDLYVYVQDYLNRHAPGHRFAQEGNDESLVSIQLPAERAAKLDDFLHSEGLQGRTLLASSQARRCRFLNRISESPRRGEEIIHQFHPLIRFISAELRSLNLHYYPLIAVDLRNAMELAVVADDTYVFYVRSWSFIGVREEDMLAVAMVGLNSGQTLDEERADNVLQLARVEGEDWPGAAQDLLDLPVKERLDHAELELDKRFHSALDRKKNENADRARFQRNSIDRHLERRIPRLQEVRQAHLAAGRDSLAKATQGQIDKLEARMNTRLERIREQERVRPERHFVCAGVIRTGA